MTRKQYQPSGLRGNPNVVRRTKRRKRFGDAMSTILAAIHVLTRGGWDGKSAANLDDGQRAMIRKAKSRLALPRGPLRKPRIWRSKEYAAALSARSEITRALKRARRLRDLPWSRAAGVPTSQTSRVYRAPASHVVVRDPKRWGYPDMFVEVTNLAVARFGVAQACAEAAGRGQWAR